MRPRTLVVDENAVENTSFIHRVNLSKSDPNLPDPSASEGKRLLTEADEVIDNGAETEDKRPMSNKCLKELEEYEVERIVQHHELKFDWRYMVTPPQRIPLNHRTKYPVILLISIGQGSDAQRDIEQWNQVDI